ncbi:hypothetical protein OGAPHI_001864 [Ogataea philodendri]|uniref:Uncharacterized protein n=1 Tax=Ogataea philodendri TaxID=1378263 RepID=A0A9P8PAQ3_9ASCO|nr:uncharacterized protein OGAPHI_001864 [Ogataea philodendri]KAH3668110.1 hypothetical protein OGAPHI_001864 [Ogataea philodendri]
MAFSNYSCGLDSDFANRQRILLARKAARYAAEQVAADARARVFNPANRPKNANKRNGILESSFERWVQTPSPSLVNHSPVAKPRASQPPDPDLQTLICGDEMISPRTGITRSHVHAKGSLQSHVRMLNTLLHINLLQGRWETSYRTFALLIRVYGTDTREMWPVGVEILHRLNEKETGCENDPVAARSRSTQQVARRYQPKIYRFLRFLDATHDNKLSEITGRYPYQVIDNEVDERLEDDLDKRDYQTQHFLKLNTAPLFKSGSKTHLAMYVMALLWELTVAGQHTQFYELEHTLKVNYAGDLTMLQYLKAINKVREGLHGSGSSSALEEGDSLLRDLGFLE